MTSENKNPLGHINRDKTGLRTVRKGSIVRFDGGLNGYVIKVRMGHCHVKGAVSGITYFAQCGEVSVRK